MFLKGPEWQRWRGSRHSPATFPSHRSDNPDGWYSIPVVLDGPVALDCHLIQHDLALFLQKADLVERPTGGDRPASMNLEGLRKSLRSGADGRYRWHWDPSFFKDRETAWRSEVVSDEVAREFLTQLPHARYLHIGGAGQMVAGDENDDFADAVVDFLTETRNAR